MNKNNCKSCDREVVISLKCDNIIKCVICEGIFHNNCVSLTPSVSKFLYTSPNCLWSCDGCCNSENLLKTILDQLKSLQSNIDTIERSRTNTLASTPQQSIQNASTSRKRIAERTLADVFKDAAGDLEYSSSPKILRVATKPKAAPIVVVKCKDKNCDVDIEKAAKDVVNPMSDPVKYLRKTKNNKIVIQCNDEAAVNKIKEKLSEKLDEN